MAKIEIKSQGSAKVYEVLDDLVTIGRDEQNHIRLKNEGAAAFEARLVRAARGWRIEAAEAGRKFTVNGLTVRAADLEPGDKVALGEVELLFVSGDGDAEAAPAAKPEATAQATRPQTRAAAPRSPSRATAGAAPARARAHAADDDRHGTRFARHLRDPKPMTSQRIGMVSAVITLAGFAVFLIWKLVTGGLGQKDPRDLLQLAEAQIGEGSAADAEITLQTLEKRPLDAVMRGEIDKLRKKVKSADQRSADNLRIQNAQRDHDSLITFAGNYFKQDPWQRKHAREFMRICKQWLEMHKEVLEKYDDVRENLTKDINPLMAKAGPIAQMESPPNKDDVIFRADRMTRFGKQSRWREAIGVLDEFLAKEQDAQVKASRRSIYAMGQEAMNDYVRAAGERIQLNDEAKMRDSLETLEFMHDTGAMPEWRPEIAKRVDELKTALKGR